MAVKVEKLVLSQEQEEVIAQDCDLKIQAFAGCGKSTTALHRLKRNIHEKSLYVSYSKPNTSSFQEKCSMHGIPADVKTFHGMAKYGVFGKSRIELESKGSHSLLKLKEYLKDYLKDVPEKTQSLLAGHAKKLLAGYCNTTLKKLEDFNYFDTIEPEKSIALSGYHDRIYSLAKTLGVLMHTGAIPVMHDYYLKLFQVKSIQLNYDTIIVDEVQDTTPCMLDIIASQEKTRKIYFGDTHQDIYGWRGASRAMINLECKQLFLTESYRFDDRIAAIANYALAFKKELRSEQVQGFVQGLGPNTNIHQDAVIARTLAGILKKSISIVEKKVRGKFGFLGDLNHYTRHEQGGSLRDVYSLFSGETPHDPYIASFHSIEEFKHECEQLGDTAYLNFIDIVLEYRFELNKLLARLKDRVVRSEEADVVMTTAHKAKGCEFRNIMLCTDFQDISKLLKMPINKRPPEASINEEINILYTAVTRGAESCHFDDK